MPLGCSWDGLGMQEMHGCPELVALSGMYLSSTRVCVCACLYLEPVYTLSHMFTPVQRETVHESRRGRWRWRRKPPHRCA